MHRPARHARLNRQRGAALMVMLVIVVMGIAAVLLGSLSTTALKNARQQTTSDALAQAKEALIGYAVSDSNRPGEFPCPDFNNDGLITITDDYNGSNCKSLIGRLPWKTLKLPDLRDGDGEKLWYVLSDSFHAGSSDILNSNTKGALAIYRADGSSMLTEAGYSAVAVIFSPGNSIGSQTRNTAAEQNSSGNYLDIANGQNNASTSGPFIAGTNSDSFNDQLVFITTRNLMPLLEQRIAGEVKRALANYYTYSGCNCYPWADSVDQWADYDSNRGLNRGWLPNNALPVNWAGAFRPPSWFFENQWYKLIYYSVAEDYKEPFYPCSDCDHDTLHVDGTTGVRALFFMPGTFAGNRSPDQLSDYLEDAENKDDDDDDYVTPSSPAGDRDRLYRLQ
jgi:type II secretory pathway pseudopilin PulG